MNICICIRLCVQKPPKDYSLLYIKLGNETSSFECNLNNLSLVFFGIHIDIVLLSYCGLLVFLNWCVSTLYCLLIFVAVVSSLYGTNDAQSLMMLLGERLCVGLLAFVGVRINICYHFSAIFMPIFDDICKRNARCSVYIFLSLFSINSSSFAVLAGCCYGYL